jgi:hypothetical protein
MPSVFATFYPSGSFEEAQRWTMSGDESGATSSGKGEEAEDKMNVQDL